MYDNNNNISQYTSNYSTISNNNNTNNNYNIRVCIRLRPLLPHEDIEYWTVNKDQNTISTTSQNKIIDNIYQSQSFSFDKIYLPSSNSQIIYIENCQNITINLLKGINGSIFTYGQTTSGKTFTMLGTPESPGILPCVLKDIFDRINSNNSNVNTNENDINDNNNFNTDEYDSNIIHNNNRYSIYITYIEIYNEVIHDLLSDKSNLKLVDDQNYNGVIVSEAEKIYIKSFEEGIKLKDYGEENRKYRDTLINEYSSRSHTIFQIFVKQKKNINNVNNNDNEGGEIYSTLNLIDLAGSEKINSKINSKTETGNINKSLFVLANVINKLAERNNNNTNIHIPYRDSKLTRLLSNCLGGNSLITMIINISPSANNYFQTLSSLRFASRAKTVKLKPKVNEKFSDRELLMIYKKQIEKYKKMIKNNNNNIGNNNENGINNKNSIYNSNNTNNIYNSNSIYNSSAFNSIYNENNNEYYENGSVNKDEYNNNNDNDNNNDDYKMKYFRQVIANKRLKLENKNLLKENENLRYLTINSSTPRLPSTLNEHNDNNNNENNFIAQFKNQIINMIKNSQNNNNNNYNNEILNNLNQIEIEYQKQLETLQQFYLTKIKNIQDKIINNNNNNNYLSNNSIQITEFSNNNNINNNNEINNNNNINNNIINNNLDYLDEIDTNISNNNNNIQSIKNEYEIKENLISKLFKEYINDIEEYYNGIIKMNPEKSKEINIEYNNKLNYIKNLYDFKQNELETNFFNKLKTITYNNNNNK